MNVSSLPTVEDLTNERVVARVAAIARAAGQVIRAKFEEAFAVWEKGPGDLLTEADMAAHRTITAALQEAFPAVPVWSEEGAPPADREHPLWLVDPLDGTSNFVHHFPTFAVSIALWQGGRPWVGVVYDPLRDHLFTACRGGGAFLDGRPLHVSDVAGLDQALVACDWTRGRSRPRLLAAVNAIGPEVHALRSLGAAALGLAYVAAGWLDAYFNAQLQPWDFAAGVLLVEEAGGRAGTWQGQPLPLATTTVVAANPRIYAVLQPVLAACEEDPPC